MGERESEPTTGTACGCWSLTARKVNDKQKGCQNQSSVLSLLTRHENKKSNVDSTNQIISTRPDTLLERVLLFVLFAYLLVDPSGQLLGLKEELFIISLGYMLLLYAVAGQWRIPLVTALIVMAFLLIPIASIYFYLIRNGDPFYFGFSYMRTFALVVMSLALVARQINAMSLLAYSLALYSLGGLIIIAILIMFPALLIPFRIFGEQTSLFFYDIRTYGALTLHSYYFSVSPMAIFSFVYFLGKPEKSNLDRFLGAASLIFLLMCGTRGNYIGALIATAALLQVHYKLSLASWLTIAFLPGAYIFFEIFSLMFSAENQSNAYKLDYLAHYVSILGQPFNALFGSGIGAYYDFQNGAGPVHTTELTYLEILRYFGFLFGSCLILVMFSPILLWRTGGGAIQDRRTITFGYGAYLLMSFVNPLFFSSTGMSLFTVALATSMLSWRGRPNLEIRYNR